MILLRSDFDAGQLRGLANRSNDPRQTQRLLALTAVYDGMSRADAARVGGMDRQTLRDWVHRFNEDGPDSLHNTDNHLTVSFRYIRTACHYSCKGRTRWFPARPCLFYIDLNCEIRSRVLYRLLAPD